VSDFFAPSERRNCTQLPTFKNTQRGTWYCKFYYTDWTGARKQKKKEGFATKRESQEWERNFLNSCSVDSDITFENFCVKYMEHCKARLKPTTYENKCYMIRDKVLPYFKNMKLKDIKASTLRTWQDKLITHKNGYSQTYLKTINNQMSAILNFAVNNEYIASNPMHRCGSMGKKYAEELLFWTIDEFKEFYEVIKDKPMSEVIFPLFFYSGMREGELLALTLNDFDFDRNTVSINKSFVRFNGQDLIQTPKTPKSKRVVTLPEQIMDLVKKYADKLYGYDPSDRLFTCTKSYLSHEMIRGCNLSGVKRIRVHDLRHSHASLLIELGFQPILVSERLGHENIETTLQTYSHLYPNKQQEVADRLSKVV